MRYNYSVNFVMGWSRVWPESSAALICTFHFRIEDLTGMIKSPSGILLRKYSIIFFVCKLLFLSGSYILDFFVYLLAWKTELYFLYLNLSSIVSEKCIFAE